jgi:hypothetical protein
MFTFAHVVTNGSCPDQSQKCFTGVDQIKVRVFGNDCKQISQWVCVLSCIVPCSECVVIGCLGLVITRCIEATVEKLRRESREILPANCVVVHLSMLQAEGVKQLTLFIDSQLTRVVSSKLWCKWSNYWTIAMCSCCCHLVVVYPQ